MIDIKLQGTGAAFDRLAEIRSPKIRRRIMKKAGQILVKSAKGRIGAQTDLNGIAFAPRADGSRRKLLVGRPGKSSLRKLLNVIETSDDFAIIGWRNELLAQIAAKQQFGYSEVVSKRSIKGRPVSNTDPATRQQAKNLIAAGYKVKRRNGRGYQTPTIKWITQNLTIGKAGLILKLLRGSKDQWKSTIPPRSFLGVTEADMRMLSDVMQQEVNAVIGTP